MSQGGKSKAYTKLGKWSTSWFLGIIVLYALISVIAAMALASSPVSIDRSIIGMAVLSSLLGLAALVAILGIARDKIWAKWLTIAIYGFVGLNAIASLIYDAGNSLNSLNGGGARELRFSLGLSSAVNNLNALTRLCMVGIGIVLVSQKPESQGK